MTRLYPPAEAARMLSVSKRTIERMMADKEIVFIWIRHQKRITEEEITRYVTEKEKLARLGATCR